MAYATLHPAGETATNLCTGDFLLTGVAHQGLITSAIKLGSLLRGFDKPYRRFSHTALVTDSVGNICEAVSSGVRFSNISRFKDDDYVVVHTNVDEHDQRQILDYCNAVVAAKYKYGRAVFAGLGLYCLTGGQLCIQKAGTAICSGLVSEALTRAGFVWERPPFAMMPADLAKHFNVTWNPGE